jgi:hypothetical protein
MNVTLPLWLLLIGLVAVLVFAQVIRLWLAVLCVLAGLLLAVPYGNVADKGPGGSNSVVQVDQSDDQPRPKPRTKPPRR